MQQSGYASQALRFVSQQDGERQDLSCTYLAHLELESVVIICHYYGESISPRRQAEHPRVLRSPNQHSALTAEGRWDVACCLLIEYCKSHTQFCFGYFRPSKMTIHMIDNSVLDGTFYQSASWSKTSWFAGISQQYMNGGVVILGGRGYSVLKT